VPSPTQCRCKREVQASSGLFLWSHLPKKSFASRTNTARFSPIAVRELEGRCQIAWKADVLRLGGKPVGLASRRMRELAGSEQAANALFNRLTASAADVTPPNFPGVVRKRSNGVTITYLLPVKGVPSTARSP
jgi:hypothetical protein